MKQKKLKQVRQFIDTFIANLQNIPPMMPLSNATLYGGLRRDNSLLINAGRKWWFYDTYADWPVNLNGYYAGKYTTAIFHLPTRMVEAGLISKEEHEMFKEWLRKEDQRINKEREVKSALDLLHRHGIETPGLPASKRVRKL